MKIDVHWHLIPPAFVDAILSGACPVDGDIEHQGDEITIVLNNGFRQPLFDRLTDPAIAVSHMDAVGLDVVTPSCAPPMMHYWADVDVAVRLSRTMNDALAEAAAQYPDRLKPLANLPMADPEQAVTELRRAVGELGFAGAAIGTNVNGANLGDDRFHPFWGAVAELDCFVFFHPVTPLGAQDRFARHGQSNFVGLPVDSAAAVASLLFDGVYERFGPLKTCFAHGGGAFPYILSRWEHGYHARQAEKLAPVKSPVNYLSSIYADSLTHSELGLRFLVDLLGDDHVVLGSDYPFDMGVPDPEQAMNRAIEDGSSREKIAGLTAARLIGLAD